jgi:hypothetical protein
VPDQPWIDPDPPDRVTREALLRVPPRQRAVLVLRFIYDLPVNEVADILGCSAGTIKSQAAHGLAAMRKHLGKPLEAGDDMDFDDARDLLRSLGDGATPPSRLDGPSLLRSGRRRVRARRLTRVGMATFATFAMLAALPLALRQPRPAEPAPASPSSCVAQPLALPAGAAYGWVDHGDSSGRYFVGSARNDARAVADTRSWSVLWDNGTPSVFSPPDGSINYAEVNSSGTVAGTGQHHGWIYREGNYSTLDTAEGKKLHAIRIADINDRGDVLGVARTSETGPDRARRVARRRSPRGAAPRHPRRARRDLRLRHRRGRNGRRRSHRPRTGHDALLLDVGSRRHLHRVDRARRARPGQDDLRHPQRLVQWLLLQAHEGPRRRPHRRPLARRHL